MHDKIFLSIPTGFYWFVVINYINFGWFYKILGFIGLYSLADFDKCYQEFSLDFSREWGAVKDAN